MVIIVLGPGHMVCALFHSPLKIQWVGSGDYFPLVVSVDYFPLVVSVCNLSGDCFQTYYMTEEACRFTIFGWGSINASVEWLGTPVSFYDTNGVLWIDNILVPEFLWGDRGNYKTWALQTQSGVHFGGRSVPWRDAVPFRPDYLPRSPVNTCTTARRVRDVCLRESRLAWAQTLSRAHHTGGDKQGNRSDQDLDGWVYQ